MQKDELFYRLALSRVEGIGPIKFKRICELTPSIADIFTKSVKQIKMQFGLPDAVAKNIKSFEDFDRIEQELKFAEKNHIQILDQADTCYPTRLKHCIDSPAILFYKGQADLNADKMIAIIGTRACTEYGRKKCEEIVEELKTYQVQIVSGLAYGIDAIAHKSAVKNQIPTIGVVAHGLDDMYPVAHKSLASEMLLQGGLLSEYFSKTRADKGNFPARNRIVAGLTDATLIIETDRKGGSMITAEIAYSYNREVFCLPGRTIDAKSQGCNYLIQNLKAQMFSNAADIAKSMGWVQKSKAKPIQKQLFLELNENEQCIVDLLKDVEELHIDEFYTKSNLHSSSLASAILSLEMQNIIVVKPGKRVSLVF
ncbi:MAG: DNA-protecting protein DprA [Bacteroidetes bacterium]|nr:DNA-protecting protein DprA [Bacteroidota bacterium]